MCILAVVGVAPMPMSHDGVAPASCPRPPGATSDGTLALRSAYIHPHNFVPFVEERTRLFLQCAASFRAV